MDRYSSPHRRHRQNKAHISPPYSKRPPSSRPAVKFAHSPKAHVAARPHIKIASVNHKVDDNNSRRISHDYADTLNDATFVEHGSDMNAGDPDMDDSAFYWEEEATLFTELMDDGPHQTEEDRLDELVHSLQAPLAELGTQAKKQIASMLVDTHKHAKKMVMLVDENVDPYYGKGIHLFKKGSTAIEATYYAREEEIKETYQTTQQKMAILFDELKADYEFRDKLWTKLEASISEIVNPVLETIKDTPAQIERTIAKLDKQLENDSTKAQNSKQKFLQELLANAF